MIGEERGIERAGLKVVYQWVAAPTRRCGVLCLHGVASNATRFHEWMSTSRLRGRCPLAAVDQRGHQRSLTYRAYSRTDWCEDLGAILAKEQLQCVLIGHSLGAQVALDYTSLYRQGVLGLILIDPVFPQALSGTLKTVARWRKPLRLLIALLRFFNRLGLRRWRRYAYRDLHQLDQQTRAFLAANPHKEIADLYMNPLADLEYMPVLNYFQDLYEVTRPLADMSAIAVPVLVLLSKGASTSDVAHNQRILSAIKNCEISVIDADHWLLTERPVEAREAIDAWCLRTLQLETTGSSP